MIHRFVVLGDVPELCTEPGDPNKPATEIQVALPVEIYWEIEELITQMRYAKVSGVSSSRHWQKFGKLLYPCILTESDRTWFIKNMGR